MRISDWSSDVCSSDLLLGAERAVEADAERLRVAHRVPESLRRLPRQRAPGGIGDGARNHHRQAEAAGFEMLADRVDRRLAVQRTIGRSSCRERVCPYV